MIDNHTTEFVASGSDAGERLDRFLASRLPHLSRTRIQELVAEGHVRVNGAAAKPSRRIEPGDAVSIEVLPRPPLLARPEAIALDILYEDDDLVVINKPAGMTVHAGAGSSSGTLVNAVLARYDALSQVGGTLRPGIVHRLDKGTSGAVIVARNDLAHRRLAEQFSSRTVEKHYLALLHGRLSQQRGTIDLPIARDLRRRTRMTTRRPGRASRTDWAVLLRIGKFTLLDASLRTGRTHQIRVHFSALGHPVVGDTLYGAPASVRLPDGTLPPLARNFLHAARILFLQPSTGVPVEVRAPLPAELLSYLRQIAEAFESQGKNVSASSPAEIDAVLARYL